MCFNDEDLSDDGLAASAAAGSIPSALIPVGRVQTVAGPATIARGDAVIAQPFVGELIYRGDIVRTGVGGQLAIAFVDGTTVCLFANAELAADEIGRAHV